MIGDVNNTLSAVAQTVVAGNTPVTFTDAGDIVTLTAHGLAAGTPIAFSIITTTTGITAGVVYYVTTVTANTFQLAATQAQALAGTPVIALTTNGTGRIANPVSYSSIDRLARHDFGAGRQVPWAIFTSVAPTLTISATANTFTDTGDLVTINGHGLVVGTPVFFVTIVTTTGITTGTTYYVTNPTTNTFQLAATYAAAIAGGPVIALTTDGTGTMTAIPVIEFEAITSDNEDLSEPVLVVGRSGDLSPRLAQNVTFTNATELVNMTAHGFAAGTPVVLGGAGTIPTGLTAGLTYYVSTSQLTANSFRMALTREDALAGAFVSFSTDGVAPITLQVRDNQLAAGGPVIFIDIQPRFADLMRRYHGVRYASSGGPFVGAQFVAKLAMDEFQKPVNHPFAYAIP